MLECFSQKQAPTAEAFYSSVFRELLEKETNGGLSCWYTRHDSNRFIIERIIEKVVFSPRT